MKRYRLQAFCSQQGERGHFLERRAWFEHERRVDYTRCARESIIRQTRWTLWMILRGCSIAGFFLIWASVVIIPLGTHLQTQAPGFPEYERQVFARIAAAHPGRDLGPGMAFAFAWPFTTGFCVFIGLLYSGGVLVVRRLVQWKRDDGLLVAGAFGLGCLAGALLGLGEAMESFRCGFAVLGLGYILSAAGLGVGAIGLVGSCRTRHSSRRLSK